MNGPCRGEASGRAAHAERVALLLEAEREMLLDIALGVVGEYGGDAAAEGVLQEAWIKVANGVELPVDDNEAVATVIQVIRHLARNRRRYEKVRQSEPLEVADKERRERSHEEPVLAKIALDRAMTLLTPSEREVVALRMKEGRTSPEIAEHRRCSEGTVRTLWKRSRRKLRASLGSPRRRGRKS